jgi:prevent-host-death family protein
VKRLDATEARKNFSDVLNQVCFGNETIVVTRHGRDIAAIVPIHKAPPPDAAESKKPAVSLGRPSRERKQA